MAPAEAFPAFTVDLDAPPENRWAKIASLPYYRDKVGAAVAYLADQVPPWLLPTLEAVLADVEGYFGPELGAGDEVPRIRLWRRQMQAWRYCCIQSHHAAGVIGLNCSNWNTTGPTRKNDPGCVDIDPKQTWCYCHYLTELQTWCPKPHSNATLGSVLPMARQDYVHQLWLKMLTLVTYTMGGIWIGISPSGS